MGLWQRRDSWAGRVGLAAGLAATVIWSCMLLGRTPDWFPALRPFVAVVGALGVVAILALPLLRAVPKLAVALVAALGFGAALAAPLFSTVATAATPHNGAIPSVTPSPAGGLGGPGGPGGGFPGGGPGGARAFARGGFPGGGFPGGAAPSFGGGFPGAGTGTGNGAFPGGFPGGAAPSLGAGGFGRAFRGGAGAGGILNASQSNPALTRLLQANAGRYTWAAATVSANSAAGYQLASGEPVMAIGGFNGTDPAPTLAQFEHDVAQGKIHYFIAGGRGAGPGGAAGGTSDDASQITSWVESHYTAETVGGVTVYNLSS